MVKMTWGKSRTSLGYNLNILENILERSTNSVPIEEKKKKKKLPSAQSKCLQNPNNTTGNKWWVLARHPESSALLFCWAAALLIQAVDKQRMACLHTV